MTISLFYSYAEQSPADSAFLHQFENQLSSLSRKGLITEFHVGKLRGGAWRQRIDEELERASLILLLISPDYMASRECERQMKRAFELSKNGHAHVVPILLRPTHLDTIPLQSMLSLPRNNRPVSLWRDRENAMFQIAEELRELIREISSGSLVQTSPAPDPETPSLSHLEAIHDVVQGGEPSPPPAKIYPSKRRIWLILSAILLIFSLAIGGVLLSIAHKDQTLVSGSPSTHHNLLTASAVATFVSSGSISEFSIPIPGVQASSITRGPDGNLWFTEDNVAKIGRIAPDGRVSEPVQLPSQSNPSVIVLGPDHNLWILENGSDEIARITPPDHITQFPLPPGINPVGLTVGPDGNLWFTEFQVNKIGRMNTAGEVTGEFPIRVATSIIGIGSISAGPDGNLWFEEQRDNKIGRISPDGLHIAEFPLQLPAVTGTNNNHNFTAGPDGNLWFTDFWHGEIGKITPLGAITEYPLPTPNTLPISITAGPDGNLWFTECVLTPDNNACVGGTNKIGRMTPRGVIAAEYVLRTPGSGPGGITVGSDNNIWFTEDPGDHVGRITK